MLHIGSACHPGPGRSIYTPGQLSVEFVIVGGWLTYGDLALDSCAQFLAAAEHRLISSRARSICHELQKAGYQSVWAPACQDQVAGGHAGVGVVLTDKLLHVVLAEAQVVCVGQPLLIAGDLNADPAVIPCLAKGISAGRFVDLALAYSLGAGRKPDATCKFRLDECAGSRGTSLEVVLMRWQHLQLVGLRIGGSLPIFCLC